jgi:F5/8 type C domain/PKD domain
MSSSRRSVTALVLAAVAACLAVAAGPASAGLIGGGLDGYVTDADTGLGVGGAGLSWIGTPAGAPPATSGPTGHYLLTGLAAGTSGTLGVTGPAGYAATTVGPLALPANDLGRQDVALHRDWAAGAPTTSDDPAPATTPQGCDPTKATDNDRATGWSASGPAALTITLPQPVEVHAVVLAPGAVCGHDAGAALAGYRVETSPDGATWTTTATGTLAGTADAVLATSTAGVRLVRVSALSAQSATATSIDLREVQVLGAGPNVPPSGTVAADAPRNSVKSVVRLRAAFTDPDSTIVRYLWDFDGDGHFDQATAGPQVAHVWTAPGIYHVIAGARDFRGGLGTTTLDLRIIDPTTLVEPILQRRPLITFDPVDGIDLPVRIACSSICTFTARIVLPKATAKALEAPRRTVLSLKKRTEGPGLGSWTIELPTKTIRLLRQAHRKTLKVRLTASAVDQQKRRTTTRRWVTFR